MGLAESQKPVVLLGGTGRCIRGRAHRFVSCAQLGACVFNTASFTPDHSPDTTAQALV